MTVHKFSQGIRTTLTKYTPAAARLIPVWYMRIVTAFCLLFFGYVAVFSLFETSVFDPEEFVYEHVLYEADSLVLNLLKIAIFIGAIWLLRQNLRLPKIKSHWLMAGLSIYVLIIGMIWVYSVQSIPAADSNEVFRTAKSIIQGDWTLFHTSGNDFYGQMSYFQLYPFQLGYVFLCEIVLRVFGGETALPLAALNVVALAAMYAGIIALCDRLFRRPTLTFALTLLLAGCVQPLLFTSFVYGNLLGFAAGIWACYFAIRYTRGKKRRGLDLVWTALLLCLAVLAKYNNLLWVVGIAVYLLVNGLRRRQLTCLLTAVIVAIAPILCQQVVIMQYEIRSGVALSDGVSQLQYLEAGLHESGMAPGWYNDRGRYTFVENNADAEAISEITHKNLRDRLAEFAADPAYTFNFFHQKILSQWNEPSYESIWVSQVKGHYNGEPQTGSLVDSVYNGALNMWLHSWFNFYQSLIFLLFSAGMVFLLRRVRISLAPMLTVLAGGAVYHLLFEGKSQYCLTYFILMVPFAAYGLYEIVRLLPRLAEKAKRDAPAHDDLDPATAESVTVEQPSCPIE